MKPRLICLTGLARSGKDEVGRILNARHGFERMATGDFIKGELSDVIEEYMGIDAFTEDDEKKRVIRPILEAWGNANVDRLSQYCIGWAKDLMSDGDSVVNTRISRVDEWEKWKAAGAELWLVKRPGYETPCTANEAIMQRELFPHAQTVVHNNGTIDALATHVQLALITSDGPF